MQKKPLNPKDIAGSNKVPLYLWPSSATALGCMAFLSGALKYGRNNFRASGGVSAKELYGACLRHLALWFDGESIDPESGINHLGHALASIAILVEAMAKGNLVDDRNYPIDLRKLMDSLTADLPAVKANVAGKDPKHYTMTEFLADDRSE